MVVLLAAGGWGHPLLFGFQLLAFSFNYFFDICSLLYASSFLSLILTFLCLLVSPFTYPILPLVKLFRCTR